MKSLWIIVFSVQSKALGFIAMITDTRVGQATLASTRRLFIYNILVCGLITLAAFSVGGPVLSLLVISTLLLAHKYADRFGTAFAICIGMIYSLVVVLVEFIVLVPVIRNFALLRSLLFEETRIQPFVAREITFENLVELNRFGAFVIAVIPALLAAFCLFRKSSRQHSSSVNPIITGISFLPLLIGAVRNFQDSLAYVASISSGDGRNFFLHVQRIRVTSGFTNLQNLLSQGDFAASLSSLVSDGLGSRGILRFDDQYAIAALYIFFGVLIAASAIATTKAFANIKTAGSHFEHSEWTYVIFLVVSIASLNMPWVMNEMFRSGFFSTVVAMSLTAAMVAIYVAEITDVHKALLLLLVAILTFAVYPMAVIYPLLTLVVVMGSVAWNFLRMKAFLTCVCVLVGVSAVILAVPRAIEQLRSRLLLDGSITFLEDSFWIPLAIAGIGIGLGRGKLKLFGLLVFVSAAGTAAFQFLAQELRESDGQLGYGYYGVKSGYQGLFIVLLTLFSGFGALVLLGLQRDQESSGVSKRNSGIRLLISAGFVLLASAISSFVLPEPRGFYGNNDGWTQPTPQALELAMEYWNKPRVLFVRITDPGNDKISNFWHPYFWSGDPWNWIYSSYGDDAGTVCSFITGKNISVVTADINYAIGLRSACGAEVEVLE
jgi:hypothetical protein